MLKPSISITYNFFKQCRVGKAQNSYKKVNSKKEIGLRTYYIQPFIICKYIWAWMKAGEGDGARTPPPKFFFDIGVSMDTSLRKRGSWPLIYLFAVISNLIIIEKTLQERDKVPIMQTWNAITFLSKGVLSSNRVCKTQATWKIQI